MCQAQRLHAAVQTLGLSESQFVCSLDNSLRLKCGQALVAVGHQPFVVGKIYAADNGWKAGF
jgi:hypothetical protein